ncbi:hypothetical protein GY45DRAFT_420277 [Cubamyces sp. BRFM 1775]|nr:hypothetical protein GY45DRAFT_420277 [Cubamyces sp. BRFM 1775]
MRWLVAPEQIDHDRLPRASVGVAGHFRGGARGRPFDSPNQRPTRLARALKNVERRSDVEYLVLRHPGTIDVLGAIVPGLGGTHADYGNCRNSRRCSSPRSAIWPPARPGSFQSNVPLPGAELIIHGWNSPFASPASQASIFQGSDTILSLCLLAPALTVAAETHCPAGESCARSAMRATVSLIYEA